MNHLHKPPTRPALSNIYIGASKSGNDPVLSTLFRAAIREDAPKISFAERFAALLLIAGLSLALFFNHRFPSKLK